MAYVSTPSYRVEVCQVFNRLSALHAKGSTQSTLQPLGPETTQCLTVELMTGEIDHHVYALRMVVSARARCGRCRSRFARLRNPIQVVWFGRLRTMASVNNKQRMVNNMDVAQETVRRFQSCPTKGVQGLSMTTVQFEAVLLNTDEEHARTREVEQLLRLKCCSSIDQDSQT
jgi:hypothetical protein